MHFGEDAHAARPTDRLVVVIDQQRAHELRIADDKLMLRPDPQIDDVAERLLPLGHRRQQIARHTSQRAALTRDDC